MQHRNGEIGTAYGRTARYFCISGEWFFSTRENLQVGPFQSRDDAEAELVVFLRHVDEGGIYAESSVFYSDDSSRRPVA